MSAAVTVVLPIFALILVGFVCRRAGLLGPGATTELNRFVVYLALPALLFDVMAHTRWEVLYQPGFVAAFGLSSALVFGLTLLLARWRGRPLADGSIDGLNAGYANVGFIGFPLALIALGRESLPPTTVATILTACVMFAVSIVLIEIGLHAGRRPPETVAKVGRALLRNPLLLAPTFGALAAASGVTLPAGIDTFLKLLGGAASPCALVALGLFLAQRRSAAAGDLPAALLFTAFKLLLHPAIAWLLAGPVFGLPVPLVQTTVLLAALPTGTGPFMLAELYRRGAEVTSATILISTVGSLLTVSAYLAWIG